MNIKLYFKITFELIIIVFFILTISVIFPRKDDSLKDNKNNSVDNEESDNVTNKKEVIIIKNEEYSVSLEDNPTTESFLAILPIEISMNELNGNEKYYFLEQKLPANPSFISDINSGDIMLYGDNCIVIFYETFKTSYSYTKIGKIDNPNELKKKLGSETVKVEFRSK
jgi:hypothetical protein